MGWQRLGGVAPSRLRSARLEAHWAAQVIAAAGETFVPHVPDTSHTAMRWEAGRLVGATLPGAVPCRVALAVADLKLLILGGRKAPAAELALVGSTLEEAYHFAAQAVRTHTGAARVPALAHPGYELPVHPVAKGGRFAGDPGLPELARWYANAAAVLERFQRETPGAGALFCWPHHFDLATLVALETDARGEPLRTLGVGLSPGDAFIDEPYWYVNHAPETSRRELPALACGEWFRVGWVGAVLRGSALVSAGAAAAQQARLDAYLASAVAASRQLALEGSLD